MSKNLVKQAGPFVLLLAAAVASMFIPSLPHFDDGGKMYNGADIAWIIVATALVFIMTPGLAFSMEEWCTGRMSCRQ